jgi:hypothetical protein
MASLERHYNLPAPEMTQSLMQGTHRRSKSNSDGKNSQADPALSVSRAGCSVSVSSELVDASAVPETLATNSLS